MQIVFLGHESGQLLRSLPQFVDLVQHLQDVLVLNGIGVELFQFFPATSEQLFACLEIFLHYVDPLPGTGNLRGHLPEQLHNPREVSIVPRDKFIQPLIGLSELLFDLELLALPLFVCLAGIEGFYHRNQQPATTLKGNEKLC